MTVGVKRNLWSTRQSGLLAPKRMNFPIDSLALYYPLWHPELSGTPIISKDLNAISGAVTGTVHDPPRGRICDGDDGIDLGNPSALDITTSFSIFVRVKPNTGAVSLQLISKDDATGGDRGWFFDIRDTLKTRFLTSLDGTKLSIQEADSANVTDGAWASFGCSCKVGIRADTALKIYTSGVIEASSWSGGGGSLGSDIQAVNVAASKTWVGRHGTAASYFDGTEGEVLVWTRVLSAEEFLHMHKSSSRRSI